MRGPVRGLVRGRAHTTRGLGEGPVRGLVRGRAHTTRGLGEGACEGPGEGASISRGLQIALRPIFVA